MKKSTQLFNKPEDPDATEAAYPAELLNLRSASSIVIPNLDPPQAPFGLCQTDSFKITGFRMGPLDSNGFFKMAVVSEKNKELCFTCRIGKTVGYTVEVKVSVGFSSSNNYWDLHGVLTHGGSSAPFAITTKDTNMASVPISDADSTHPEPFYMFLIGSKYE